MTSTPCEPQALWFESLALTGTLRFCIAIFLSLNIFAAGKVEVGLAPEPLLKARLARGLVRDTERQRQISLLFLEAGCKPEEEVVNRDASNVICTLSGETAETIVVGAHFDIARSGQGILDDWSGVAMLPSLYQSLKGHPRRHTYVFIAFAALETGLQGSRKYVSELSSARKKQISAFVDLESLGAAMPSVWLTESDRKLAARLGLVARTIGVKVGLVSPDGIGEVDARSFQHEGIPSIIIHSLTTENLHVLHSYLDDMGAIRQDFYFASYKLVAWFLAYLD